MTNWNAAFNPLADMVREARTREEKSKELADMDHDDAEQTPDNNEGREE